MASTRRALAALFGQPHSFLVPYCDASCLYRAVLLVRATRGRSARDSTCLAVQISWAIAPAASERCAVTEQPAAKSMDTEMQDAQPARPAPLIVGRPSLKRPLSSDGVGSLPSKLYAATIDGSPAPSPRRREVSLAGTKRSRSGEDEAQAQARRRQLSAAAPLPAPVAPEPPTRTPTPAPEPTVPATWLDLMRSLQTDGASPYPLPPRARRPPR